MLLQILFTLGSAILAALGEQSAENAGYRLTPIPHNPGLYYEKIDQIRFVNNKWRLTIILDLDRLMGQPLPGQREMNYQLEQCQNLTTMESCQNALRTDVMKSLSKELSHQQSHLTKILQVSTTRSQQRRSPLLGFVGSIARKIFGTMDYNDHEHITKEIDQLYNDQRQITHLIGNSTHLIQAEINSMRTAHEKEKKKIKLLEEKINNQRQTAAMLASNINKIAAMEELSQLGVQLESTAHKYVNNVNQIAEAVEDAQHGILNSRLLSGPDLEKAIEEIEKSSPDSIFPISKPKLTLAILSQISTIETGYNNGRFLVTVIIPLLSREPSELFKMIPCRVPQTIQGDQKTSAYIQPRTSHAIISRRTSKYALVNEDLLKRCTLLENCLACPRGLPMRKAQGNTDCEYKLLTSNDFNITEIFKTCNVRVTNNLETQWTELTATDGWIFSTMKPESLEVTCNQEAVTSIVLEGSGTLTLSANCSAETATISLEGMGTLQTQLPAIHGLPATINIAKIHPALSKPIKLPSLITNMKQYTLPNNTNTDPFGTSLDAIVDTANKIGLHHQESYHHQIFSAVNCGITGGLTIILGIISAVLYKMQINPCCLLTRYCRKRKRSPPKRRLQISTPQVSQAYEPPRARHPQLPPPPPPTMVYTRAPQLRAPPAPTPVEITEAPTPEWAKEAVIINYV